MAIQREITAKSILTKSGISDYAVNCYVGCLHNCVYCYARYMRKFTNHSEPWGQFLDVKINAVELLEKEVKRKTPGSVFFSSTCDAWQPAERKYELTRNCLRIAAEAGFKISALTKSDLVVRDLDILSAAPDASLGCTITTLDESLRRKIEIAASSTEARIRSLEKAKEAGIRTWLFCGPLMPGLTDTQENIEQLFRRFAQMGLSGVNIDKLNFRSGVLESCIDLLQRFYPHLIPLYKKLCFIPQESEAYTANLKLKVEEIARASGLDKYTKVVF